MSGQLVEVWPPDHGRWSHKEIQLIADGVCPWQVAYGLPWDEYCGERAAGASLWCEDHILDVLT